MRWANHCKGYSQAMATRRTRAEFLGEKIREVQPEEQGAKVSFRKENTI